MRYLIQMDFSKSRQFRKGDAELFGEKNEGVTVEAESGKQAIETLNTTLLPGKRYNPFYLKASTAK